MISGLLVSAAQILIAGYFLTSTIMNVLDMRGSVGLLRSKKIPVAVVLFWCSVALRSIGSISILLDIYPLLGAGALAFFVLVANIIFNDFWRSAHVERKVQLVQFMMCNSLIGGLLLLMVAYMSQ